MRFQRTLELVSVTSILALLLTGCGAPAATPTLVPPTATPAAVPPTATPVPILPTTTTTATPTFKPVEKEIHHVVGRWKGVARTWIDANSNGVWDEGEAPLSGVVIHSDRVLKDGEIYEVSDLWKQVTDATGEAILRRDYLIWGKDLDARFEIEVYPDVPQGYRLTTAERVLSGSATPLEFGFVPLAPTAKPSPSATPTPEPSPTPSATSTPAPTATSKAPPSGYLCDRDLDLFISFNGVEELAVVTCYECRGVHIDSTSRSPAKDPSLVVPRGIPLHFRLAAERGPTEVEMRLYPEAGVSASFFRWPEELPIEIEPVDIFQPAPSSSFDYLPQAPAGEYSLVIRAIWEEAVDVFYAISFRLE